MEDERDNPKKYTHETSEYSRYLALKYDVERGIVPKWKQEEYVELKKKIDKIEEDKSKEVLTNDDEEEDNDELKKFVEE